MYNLAINLPDIMEYDVYMTTIYDKLKKKFTTFAENFHHKALSKDINIEYHLCMINFYNNNDVNTQKLYNYYYDNEDYYNCLKLIDKHNFWDRVLLYNNVCDFNIIQLPMVIEYAKHNKCSPLLLKYIGMNNEIVDKCTINYLSDIPNIGLDIIKTPVHNNPTIGFIIDNLYTSVINFIQTSTATLTNGTIIIYDLSSVNIKCRCIMKGIIYHRINEDNESLMKEADILINMCNIDNKYVYTILAKRPAPIQVNYIGYLGTTNQDYIDYYITDSHYIDNFDYHFSEKLIILPNSFIPCDHEENYPDNPNTKMNYDNIIATIQKEPNGDMYEFVIRYFYKIIKYNIDIIFKGIYNKEFLIERQIKSIIERFNISDENMALFKTNYNKIKNLKKRNIKESTLFSIYSNIILPKCKQKNVIRFCCLSGLRKLSRKDLIIYQIILDKIPKSVLYIMETVPVENRENILKYFDSTMKDRIYFMPYIAQHLNMTRLLYFDCVLDTLNYNLKTMVFDVLWCGLPIITVEGITPETRITASILKNLGVSELVCSNTDEYIMMAQHLADKTNYQKLKHQIEKLQSHSIFKINTFVDKFNKIYGKLVHNYNNTRVDNIII
jgi:hypothetical protein